jgi:integrase
MANVLSEAKRQQVIALGRLGWPLRRIEAEIGVRREAASVYLRAAGPFSAPPTAPGLAMLVYLAVTASGLRRSEILALRWGDMDLDNRVLHVRRTLEQARGGLRFKEPKTEKERRLVALGPDAVETLRRPRREQIKERLALGQAYKNSDLTCARLHGTPLEPSEVTAGFAKLIKSLDLPRVRRHDLRHGHATHLLRLGIHPKVVSERLGHSGVGTTLNTCSHVLPGMQEDAARRLDQALSIAKQLE